MKKLVFIQKNPQLGTVKVQMIIDGWKVYLKRTNQEDISKMVEQLRANKVTVTVTDKLVIINWLDQLEEVKLGGETLTRNLTPQRQESILAEFYCLQYNKMGFEAKDITGGN